MEDRDSHLNSIEIEEARCYLTFIAKGSEPFCGLNADDGKGCGKTVSKLTEDWIIKKKLKGDSLDRKHPFLVINEKSGFGLHRYKNKQMEYCGNINYYCYSCNQKEKRIDSNVQVDPHAGYSNTKSRKVRPKFKQVLLDQIIKFGDICEESCVNKWSDTDMFDCAQKLLRESINQLIDRRILRVKKDEWGFKCEYSMCSGFHLIHFEKHYQPLSKITDQQSLELQLKANEK